MHQLLLYGSAACHSGFPATLPRAAWISGNAGTGLQHPAGRGPGRAR
jgi:hypothetical protein